VFGGTLNLAHSIQFQPLVIWSATGTRPLREETLDKIMRPNPADPAGPNSLERKLQRLFVTSEQGPRFTEPTASVDTNFSFNGKMVGTQDIRPIERQHCVGCEAKSISTCDIRAAVVRRMFRHCAELGEALNKV